MPTPAIPGDTALAGPADDDPPVPKPQPLKPQTPKALTDS